MTTYLVPFDDDDLVPWVRIFKSENINDVKDKIINYVLDNYEFDSKISLEYDDFCEDCAAEGLYIGKIKELDEI